MTEDNEMTFDIDNRMHWYNYDTDEYDYIDTPEDYAPYVPKGAARNLYTFM